jgi:predicted ATP-grasp superfamily ATP-dependent carboligase
MGGGGLGIARNLGSVGIDVYCLTSHRFDPAIFSKYCKGFAVVPGIAVDSEKLKTSLNILGKKLPRKGVIFPAGDNSVLTLSSIINELDNYISFIPDRKIVETLVLKKKFYKSLREHGVPHPLTLNTDETDLNEVEEKISLPVFIKPSHSSIFGDTFGGKKGFVANTLRELRSYLRLAEKHETDVMVQEIIPGPTSNEYVIRGYLDKRSEPVVLFANQKIRKSSMFSNPSAHKSIPISHLADQIDVVVDYLKSIKYRGLFGAELKRDSRNGVFKLLEINARIMGVNNFPPACGVNNVLTAYLDVLGEEVQPVKDYDIGVYSIDFIKDLKIILRFLAKGQFTRETMLPYLRKKIWYILSMDDPIPFFIHLLSSL